MSRKITIKKDVAKREVTVERILDGPQELVWRCLTTPEYMDQWWGPEGWVTDTKSMDARPGGTWHYRMHGDGIEVWGLADYEAVEKPHRLTYTESASNAAADKLAGKQQYVTITLDAPQSEQTNMTIYTRFRSVADLEAMMRMGMIEGYDGALDKLEIIIKKEQHGAS
jgi:uncharacterized protein YndB with AHSA1/START domain